MKEKGNINKENEFYKIGFFGTTIKDASQSIKRPEHIVNWLNAMYNLAVSVSTKHWWGSDKSDEKGMASLKKAIGTSKLNENEYKSFPKLLELLVILNKISIGSKKAWTGRTKQKGFKITLEHSYDTLENCLWYWFTVDEKKKLLSEEKKALLSEKFLPLIRKLCKGKKEIDVKKIYEEFTKKLKESMEFLSKKGKPNELIELIDNLENNLTDKIVTNDIVSKAKSNLIPNDDDVKKILDIANWLGEIKKTLKTLLGSNVTVSKKTRDLSNTFNTFYLSVKYPTNDQDYKLKMLWRFQFLINALTTYTKESYKKARTILTNTTGKLQIGLNEKLKSSDLSMISKIQNCFCIDAYWNYYKEDEFHLGNNSKNEEDINRLLSNELQEQLSDINENREYLRKMGEMLNKTKPDIDEAIKKLETEKSSETDENKQKDIDEKIKNLNNKPTETSSKLEAIIKHKKCLTLIEEFINWYKDPYVKIDNTLKNNVKEKLVKLDEKLQNRYNKLIEMAKYFNAHYSNSPIINLPKG